MRSPKPGNNFWFSFPVHLYFSFFCSKIHTCQRKNTTLAIYFGLLSLLRINYDWKAMFSRLFVYVVCVKCNTKAPAACQLQCLCCLFMFKVTNYIVINSLLDIVNNDSSTNDAYYMVYSCRRFHYMKSLKQVKTYVCASRLDM